MLKGFYNTTSGMLTQSRMLDTISNNVANATTAGFKRDTLITSTFEDTLRAKTGMLTHNGYEIIGETSMIRTATEQYTDMAQGAMDETGRSLDFAIDGDGFFAIQGEEEEILYTRNGSFTLNNEGFLVLDGVGNVLSDTGEPIQLTSDNINCTELGVISDGNTGEPIATLMVQGFVDLQAVLKTGEGFFVNEDPENLVVGSGSVMWQMLERSNIDTATEMTAMLQSQRAIQSLAQIMKIYDTLMDAAANEIGRL